MARLTKENRRKLLENNEGFSTNTYYSGKNSSESRKYEIRNGELHVTATGNTSWSDSRYEKHWGADGEETHRFLYRNQSIMNSID